MKFAIEKEILPYFPITPHLPFNPNTSVNDEVASFTIANTVFSMPVHVEEKIDGASVGMTIFNGEPLIRNRDHILRKGYEKDTPAKKQFKSIWGWWYERKECFQCLEGYSVYGEWMKARHGIYYCRLPDWFIAYDLFDQSNKTFIQPIKARKILTQFGFSVPEQRFYGYVKDYQMFSDMANKISSWSSELSEGIYVKTHDEFIVTGRFKMVRPGYVRGKYWDFKKMSENNVAKR